MRLRIGSTIAVLAAVAGLAGSVAGRAPASAHDAVHALSLLPS
jgi:hypothetical protein